MPQPNWWDNPPESLDGIMEILATRSFKLNSQDEEGNQLRALLKRARLAFKSSFKEVKEQYPLAFFQPSYEQALILNSWVWGIDFPIIFAANRIGKTVVCIINALLWIFPNDPNWIMFSPYVDEYGQLVQVLPRPPLENLRKIQDVYTQNPQLFGDPYAQVYATDNSTPLTPNAELRVDPIRQRLHEEQNTPILDPSPEHQKDRLQRCKSNARRFALLKKYIYPLLTPCYPQPPLQYSGQLWTGAPDADYHKRIIMRRWRDWLPKPSIVTDSESKTLFVLEVRSPDPNHPNDPQKTITYKHEIVGKSYESKDTKWSGDAVHGIILTEGFTSDILNEVKNRLAEPAFASWDYTPYEARNVGARTALAYRVFKGEEELPLSPFIYRKFSVRNAPSYVVPRKKRLDMIRMWGGKPEGAARLEGDFFASSGLVLESLNKEIHCLPDLTLADLQALKPNLQYFRGFDPGYDHPAVCWWCAIDDTNTYYFYRCYAKRGTTIAQRCKDIIELSNNSQHIFRYGNGKDEYYIQEIHDRPNSEIITATITDYKMFKADENTGQCLSLNYIKEGLNVVESAHKGPEDRALEANNLLDTKNHKYHPHPITGLPPAPRIFFLTKGLGVAVALAKFDNLFWDRYRSGDYAGEPKDKVPVHGDDELDALCNIVCSPFKFTGYTPKRNMPSNTEHLEHMMLTANGPRVVMQ